ncbi:hypothetical protein GGI35DRAFT_464471 [Trichoderma velutinum]
MFKECEAIKLQHYITLYAAPSLLTETDAENKSKRNNERVVRGRIITSSELNFMNKCEEYYLLEVRELSYSPGVVIVLPLPGRQLDDIAHPSPLMLEESTS